MRWGALAPGLIVALVSAAPAVAAPHDLILVSRADGPFGVPGDWSSFHASISADGRYVAFESEAGTLSPDDTRAPTSKILVRDLVTGTTTLVSRGSGVNGPIAAHHSRHPSISADGRFVAFQSEGHPSLDPDDTNARSDVYVRDLLLNTTTLVSRADGHDGAVPEWGAIAPAISGDGRFVVFQAAYGDLIPGGPPNTSAIFLRDIVSGETRLMSGLDGMPPEITEVGNAREATISRDGRRVAFRMGHIFVRDLQSGQVEVATRADGPDGAPATEHSWGPSLSDDGRFVAFTSEDENLTPDDNFGPPDVFVRDLAADTTHWVSRPPSGDWPWGDYSTEAAISGDGRYVAFASLIENLSDEDAEGVTDIFLYDTADRSMDLVSRAAGEAGVPANGSSRRPDISSDGRWIAFDSAAENLSTEDEDHPVRGTADVFVRGLDGSGRPAPADQGIPVPHAGASPGTAGGTVFKPPAPARPRGAPVLSRLTLSRARIRAAGRRPTGTVIRFTLSERARIRVVIRRLASPRTWVISRTRFGPGRQALRFTGKVRGRALPAGAYRIRLTAIDMAGNRSASRSARLVILR